jgi:superfamily II DNA or RNA helicase
MILRPYQQALVEQARDRARRRLPVVIQLVTGGGKTPTVCAIIEGAVAKCKRALFLAHRNELLTQASDKLSAFGVPHGLVKAGELREMRDPVQVASVQTLVRRLDKIKFVPDLIVIDEAHLAETITYKKILARFPEAYLIGLSATPGRLDGRGLGKPKGNFEAMVCGPPMTELIERGYLVPLRYFAAPNAPDVSGITVTGGDYNIGELGNLMDTPAITGDVVSHWQRIARDRKTLVFCVSIQHADHVAAQFRSAGVHAVSVSGKTDSLVRAMALKDFENGGIDVIVNCQLFAEGIDIPAIGCVADLAPTQSLTRYLQRAGRGMRPFPGKTDCIYLDHASNVRRFGLPTEPREWSLEGAESRKKSEERAAGVRVCPKCFAASGERAKVCEDCGHVFEVKQRQEIEQKPGELQEITAEELARRRERQHQGRAATLQQLRNIERIKGYKPGWALRVMAGRQRKKESA